MGILSLYFTLHMPHCIFKITKKIKKKLPDLAENYYLRGEKDFLPLGKTRGIVIIMSARLSVCHHLLVNTITQPFYIRSSPNLV